MFSKFAIFSAIIGTVFAVQAERYNPYASRPQMGGYGAPPQMGYGMQPQMPYGRPQMGGYGAPQMPYGRPQMPYGAPQMPYGAPQMPYGAPQMGHPPMGAPGMGAPGMAAPGMAAPGAHPQGPQAKKSQTVYSQPNMETKYATCSLADPEGKTGVTGTLLISQTKGEKILIQGSVSNLSPGLHGFHVHEFGDVSGTCKSTGGHFNPFNTNHGAHDDPKGERHAGDFLQMDAGEDGIANYFSTDALAMLWGDNTIIGRAMVVHGGEDDLGDGGDAGSLANGNAGPRVACCVIGIDEKPKITKKQAKATAASKWTDNEPLTVSYSAKVRVMKGEVEPMVGMRLSGWKPKEMQTATTAGWKHRITVETNQGELKIEVMDKPGHGKSGLVITKL